MVVGQDRFLERVMVAMLAQGHLLVEGVPGLAKTLIVRSLAQALALTAIVISFATTALFLVLLLAARGLTGTDHVDGREKDS